jgi:isoleucyl-tRNA synthetase
MSKTNATLRPDGDSKLYGADSLRFALMNSARSTCRRPEIQRGFGQGSAQDLIIPCGMLLFFVTYANIDGYEPSETALRI